MKLNFYMNWTLMMLFISITSFYFSIMFIMKDTTMFIEWKLFNLNSHNMYYLLIFDWISLMFISTVTLISSMVIFYSINYMGIYNYSSNRFLFLVILFVLSMILMIMSPNLVSILLGWDGLGLVSYCLVIYYQSMKSYLAGMITCLTNRLGDIGILITIAWLMSYGSWHFMFYLNFFNPLIYKMIFISAFTKSAQIPFSSWLPAAMAAPTPVSALVHSSTLVTAGVYMLIRFFNKFNYNNMFFLTLTILTMFMSSFCANYEFDLKKIIALSTLSQLGLMMSSLFMGLVDMSFFHLLTHAMFKSLLFLCAGIFIFYMKDNQDIRFMGTVSKMMPFNTVCFNISNLTLCGLPFLSGFYSKDLIVESSLMNEYNIIFYMMFYICLGLTSCYTIRLFFYSVMFDIKLNSIMMMVEEKMFMKFSIFVLTMFSLIYGSSILWMISINFSYLIMPMLMKIMSFLFILAGMMMGYNIMNFKMYLFNMNYYLFGNMWFMFSYSNYMYKILYNISFKYNINLNWGEYYGAMGISYYLLKLSNYMNNYMMNNLKIMLFSFLIWFLLLN
uniref:NADH dehydrogenase subunit 5 n=1 Tax=Anaka burmensis TaxID=2026963 RepID=UPI002551CE81|nr:NADH dehydrogenase subunit 5 [Anaka burmensis]UNZ99517.1 NADH dehydrogenase subunit 5 [Anaka burmensis]